MKIVFSESSNPKIIAAIDACPEIEAIREENLESACRRLMSGDADGMIAGIDYTTRDVIMAARDLVQPKEVIFSSAFLMCKDDQKIVIGDCAVTKHPNVDQLSAIITQTYETASLVLDEEPRIAMLSFSTNGSGGCDNTVDIIKESIERIRLFHPEIKIGGEMQLDAAIVPEIGKKKFANSPVAGRANVLICPDLNSGNILYKSMEYFGGWTAAGPILQGFKKPISDLSRGSSVEDIILVIKTMEKLK